MKIYSSRLAPRLLRGSISTPGTETSPHLEGSTNMLLVKNDWPLNMGSIPACKKFLPPRRKAFGMIALQLLCIVILLAYGSAGAQLDPSPHEPKRAAEMPKDAIKKDLSPRERDFLRRIHDFKSSSNPSYLPGTWRRYGECVYNWSAWKLLPNSERSTKRICDSNDASYVPSQEEIRVRCSTAQLGRRNPFAELPRFKDKNVPSFYWMHVQEMEGGADEMVAALCANISK